LVLSRAFNFEQKGDNVMDSLITTLSSLPENLVSSHVQVMFYKLTGRSTKPSSMRPRPLPTSSDWRSCNNSKSSSRTRPSRNR